MAFRVVNRTALRPSDDSTARELRVQLVVALSRQVVLNIELLELRQLVSGQSGPHR